MNNPQVLQYYSQLLLFKEDFAREVLTFPPSLPPTSRRIVHTLAHGLGLGHVSKGLGDNRSVSVFRQNEAQNMSPPMPHLPGAFGETQRRGLNRAATTDFSDVREQGFASLHRQPSNYLGFPESPGGLSAGQNLRAAKSYADLRSYTPSPVPSTASFPATLSTNFSRFQNFGETSSASTNPNITPTTTSMAGRDENLLVNGLGGMSLGGGAFGQSGSPRGLRGMMSWDRETPGPIGGHRSFSTNHDDQSRDRGQGMPQRQPRGPIPERGQGFSRGRPNGHQGRGSDELSSQSGVEIVVE